MDKHQSLLTEAVRNACQTIVRKHFSYEAPVFDEVWSSFWNFVGCNHVEDLQAAPSVLASPRPVTWLGAAGSEAMDTLSVIAAITHAALALMHEYRGTPPNVDAVVGALRTSGATVAAPEHVRRILERHGAGLLIEQFAARGSPQDDGVALGECAYELWVQWCEERAKKFDHRQVRTGRFAPEQAQSRFEREKDTYDLYVDERDQILLVRNRGRSVPVKWRKELDPRHLYFLGLVLEALCHGQAITYHDIALRAFKDEEETWRGSISDIHRTKSELDKTLKGCISRVLHAPKRADQYRIQTQIRYCWIRVDGIQSSLFRESPANANGKP